MTTDKSEQPFKIIVLALLRQGHEDKIEFINNLTEAERHAIGTQELWSAKDHLAHRTFWHQVFIHNLTTPSENQGDSFDEEDGEMVNTKTFEKNKSRSWSDIYAESEQTYTTLISLIQKLSEEDLTTPNRFPSIAGEMPLYAAFLGGCYEHDQEHLAQYYSDRNNLAQAIKIREDCVSRILENELPNWVNGSFLYNLACFYAQQNQLEKAKAQLQKALKLDPHLKEQSEHDPALIDLRE